LPDFITIPQNRVISEIIIKKILNQARRLKINVKIPGLHNENDEYSSLKSKGAVSIN
jgi:hypothetical protein